jgi:FkbM family methyltransferase
LTTFGRTHGIAVTIADATIRLHPRFATVSWEGIETVSYRTFAQAISEGDVVYDVGAHIGTYSVIAAQRVGTSGAVVAYEPNPTACEYLRRHLNWNQMGERVQVREVACGATAGAAQLYWLPGESEGSSGLIAIEGFAQRQVQVTTLDAEVTALQLAPTLIKIDVEGAEWEVLQGAHATLRSVKPHLLISLHPTALAKVGATAERVLAWLEQQGYRYQELGRDHEVHIFAQAR